MTPSDFNHYVWHLVNGLGWWWWSIPVVLSMWILAQLYRMDEAKTFIGRTARVVVALSCILMFSSPWFNVAGVLAFPLALFGLAVLLTQTANACAARRHRATILSHHGAVTNMRTRLARAAVARKDAA